MTEKRIRLIMFLQATWTVLVLGLGLWWATLLLKQAETIEILAVKSGSTDSTLITKSLGVRRMLFWESGTYFVLIIVVSIVLLWLYARERSRAKGLQAFFASVTHELKTPLTSIRLQAESLQDEAPQSKLLKRLLTDTTRLETQVERTLELARVEGGGSYFSQPLELRSFIQHTLKPWQDHHSEEISFEMNLPERIEVLADTVGLSVILRNIIENSIRHSGGEKIKIQITAGVSENIASLKISDSGKGFQGDIKNLGKLFQKSASSLGAGVGLYLVKNLTERMKSKIEFYNENGFVVVLHFPLAKNKEATS